MDKGIPLTMTSQDTASVKKVSGAIKKRQKKQRRRTLIRWLKRLSIGSLIGLVGFGIVKLDQSSIFRVNHIVVSNNLIYTEAQIKSLLNIDIYDRTWLIYQWFKENRIKNDPVLEEVTLSIKNNILLIQVKESKAVGLMNDRLLLENGNLVDVADHHQSLLASIPIISGFEEADYPQQLALALSSLEPSMLFYISMIVQKQTSYDDAQLHLFLQDHNQVFSDFRSLYLLNDYKYFVNQIKPENKCIYLDAISSSAISQPCEGE